MVFSATTAIYVGNTSCSKAYIGTTQVWPVQPSGRYKLENAFDDYHDDEKYVLISPNQKKIFGYDGSSFVSIDFSGFTGEGYYDAIPSGYSFVNVHDSDGYMYLVSGSTDVKIYASVVYGQTGYYANMTFNQTSGPNTGSIANIDNHKVPLLIYTASTYLYLNHDTNPKYLTTSSNYYGYYKLIDTQS